MNQALQVLLGGVAGTSLLLLHATALGAETPTERAIKYRQSIMTLVGANFEPMGAMVKGKIPFDQAAFAGYASDLEAVTSLDVLRGFPPDSEGEGSKAKGEIWLNWEDFQEKLQTLRTQADKLAEVSTSGDQDAIKDQFAATAKACKSCHDDYKE